MPLPQFPTQAPLQPFHRHMYHLPLAAVLQEQVAAPLSSLVGKKGCVEAVSTAGAYGVLIKGLIDGRHFMGVLGGGLNTSSASSSTPVATVEDRSAKPANEFQAPKRARTSSEALRSPQSSSKELQLPDTIESLLTRLVIAPEQGHEHSERVATTRVATAMEAACAGGASCLPPLKNGPTSSDRAIAIWQNLDSHKRSMVQNAVRADEERYRAEVCLRDAQIAVEAAQRRRDSAMNAASNTLAIVRQLPLHPPHTLLCSVFLVIPYP
jgi:hypothetical protein